MVACTAVLPSLLLIASAHAAPWPQYSKHSTHRTHYIRRGLKVESYHPKTTFQTYGPRIDSTSSMSNTSLEDLTSLFISTSLQTNSSSVSYTTGYAHSDTLSYTYARQMHDGVPFVNAVANLAIHNGEVVAFGSSFVDTGNIALSTPSISVEAVIQNISADLGWTHNGSRSLKYLTKSDGSIALTYAIQMQDTETNFWGEAYVDAHTGEMLGLTDYGAHATYNVVPITKSAVTDGTEKLVDPEDLESSPLGWTDGNNTSGNNVVSYKDVLAKTTAASSDGIFDYAYDTRVDPSGEQNLDAARVNGFYVINKLHDILYRYGWTEKSFNFQHDNMGKGGVDGDRVSLRIQDSTKFNNADFNTPPDGLSGICRMFVWNVTTPFRDSSLENDILVHEFTHGLTNRMIGGGSATCLQTTEAGGMGEGWSDMMAAWTEQTSEVVDDFVVGAYVANRTAGIRSRPYSTKDSVNNLRYSSLQSLNEVHEIGEVWANILYNVYAALVGKHGWSSTAETDATGSEGNVVFLRLFVDSLACMPCNPNFQQARDAFIQADAVRYAGANKCTIWSVFASKGLGLNATDYEDDSTVPHACKVERHKFH